MQNNPEDTQGLSEVVFAWKCPEYTKHKKNILWYFISFILLAVFVGYAIYTTNYLFAIFLGLFYLVVIMYEFRNPNNVDCLITIDGIKHGKNFFYFKNMDDFFIIYQDHGIKNLYVDFKNPLKGRMVVGLEGQDAVAIREFLLQFLEEDLEREAEPISERLSRFLKI
jgi:hypothetical protein